MAKKFKCHGCNKSYLRIHEYFNKNKHRKDGLDYFCRNCSKKRSLKWANNNRDRMKKNRKIRIERKIKNGECITCPNKSLKYNKNYCLKCWFTHISMNHFNTRKCWSKIKNIAEKQKYKCTYTGVKLVPGFNMSLDHKYPKSRYLNKFFDMKNLQWVVYDVNMKKGHYTHEEFLNVCKLIYENLNLSKRRLNKNMSITNLSTRIKGVK